MAPMIPALFTDHQKIIGLASGFFLGGSATRLLVYVSSQMPPLPANSGWWTQFIYKLVKGASGLDPSAVVLPPARR